MKKLIIAAGLTLSISYQAFAAPIVCLPEKAAHGHAKSFAEKAVISADRKSLTLVIDSEAGKSETGNLVPTEDGPTFEEWFARRIGLQILVMEVATGTGHKINVLVSAYGELDTPQALVCDFP